MVSKGVVSFRRRRLIQTALGVLAEHRIPSGWLSLDWAQLDHVTRRNLKLRYFEQTVHIVCEERKPTLVRLAREAICSSVVDPCHNRGDLIGRQVLLHMGHGV